MSSRSSRILESELGRAKCKNCGADWGKHQGTKCPYKNAEFEPEGFSLYDICKNCGKPLMEHHRRAECVGTVEHFFERTRDMFNDEDFLL